jgi:hypothetical protein
VADGPLARRIRISGIGPLSVVLFHGAGPGGVVDDRLRLTLAREELEHQEPLERANSCLVAANLVLTAIHQERHRVPGFQCCLEKIVVSIDPEFQTPTTPLNREAQSSPLRGQLRIDRDFVALQ